MKIRKKPVLNGGPGSGNFGHGGRPGQQGGSSGGSSSDKLSFDDTFKRLAEVHKKEYYKRLREDGPEAAKKYIEPFMWKNMGTQNGGYGSGNHGHPGRQGRGSISMGETHNERAVYHIKTGRKFERMAQNEKDPGKQKAYYEKAVKHKALGANYRKKCEMAMNSGDLVQRHAEQMSRAWHAKREADIVAAFEFCANAVQDGWFTVKGARVFAEGGKITKGPKALLDALARKGNWDTDEDEDTTTKNAWEKVR